VHNGYPVVVMVSGMSASASEIFAGALQDWDAGFIIGQPTYGKGTVQTVFSLSDSEALKVTTAKYYTPSGRSINKDHRKKDHGKKISSDEEEKDGKAKDRPVFNTASGRVVYGGGGITPDFEIEPQKYTELERRLERDALFFSFAIDYSTKHEVGRDFMVTDAVMRDFKDFLHEKGFEYKEEDLTEENLDYIKVGIMRELMSKNFGRDEMYRVLLRHDDEFQKAISLLQKAPTLEALFSYADSHHETKKASLE